MRIVAALGHVKDARRQAASDQLRDQLERITQLRRRIRRQVIHAAGDAADRIGTDLRIERRTFQEVQH